MKNFAALFACLFVFGLAQTHAADESPKLVMLSDEEKSQGWKLLFDGEDVSQWRGLGIEEFPSCWKVQDGCLKCLGGYKDAVDLVTIEKYDNFEFSFEWAFPKSKGNSGVKYRVQETKGKGYAFGPEYQCFNDPDKVDLHSSGSLYDVVAPSEAAMLPKGEFNRSRIVVQSEHVEHWLNDKKVVEADFKSDELNARVAKSYFKKSNWAKAPLGHIALQNHHSEILFRNIKIRSLPAKTAP